MSEHQGGWLQNLPVKRHLMLVIVATSSAVLLLACGVLGSYELFEFRASMVRDMGVLADVLGKNTRAALAFQDEEAAGEVLLALQAEPHVAAAAVYRLNGAPFAQYVRPGDRADVPPSPGMDGASFQAGHLLLFRPIFLEEKRIGTIHVRADLDALHARLRLFVLVGGLVWLGALAFAFALSSWLQRAITRPLLQLTETARAVGERQDYSVRTLHRSRNEIGVLASSFNQMLTGIEERDRALHTANSALRSEIAERELAEETVQDQLARLELLHQITRAIADRLDLRSTFQVMLSTLEERLPLDHAFVCLYDREGKKLVLANLGPGKELPDASVPGDLEIDVAALSGCIHGHMQYEPDVKPGLFHFLGQLGWGESRSLVATSLRVESEVFGVLVGMRKEAHSFSRGECEFLCQVSEHAALAARQAQIYGALQGAYDELRETQASIVQQERLRVLGQMASGIAHDINNAISPAALYTESLLESEPNLSERARGYLQTIQQAVDDVAATVSRMKDFYRQRGTQLALAPVAVNELVPQVVELTRAHWRDLPQQRGLVIEMDLQLAADLPAIMGVESEIRDALTNLIVNAVDAMPEGGTVTVRTRFVDPPGGAEGAPRVRLEVSDTGVGMDEDTRARCLEPFFTTKGVRGTGLGLAMVYGMVQRHSAEIDVQSAVGRGTAVVLSFAVPAVTPSAPGTPEPARGPARRLRVLVIDDDPLLLRALVAILEGEGHQVVSANGGEAGVDVFGAHVAGEPFDVAITDLGMPGMDGRRVATAIKERSRATPVILLTGWGERLVAEGDIPKDVDRVLSKPPKLRDLREALATCCPERKA